MSSPSSAPSSPPGPWPSDPNYYRLYALGDPHGSPGSVKFVLGEKAQAALRAAGLTPATASDHELADYAEHYFEYGDGQHLTRHVMLNRALGQTPVSILA